MGQIAGDRCQGDGRGNQHHGYCQLHPEQPRQARKRLVAGGGEDRDLGGQQRKVHEHDDEEKLRREQMPP